jgi:ribosomal protein S18 acetylase RimI-like enzyme
MVDEMPTAPLVIRLATREDIAQIELLDSFSSSPTRNIHREVEKYFGSVEPSIHEQTVVFLAEVGGRVAAKAELMLPPVEAIHDPTEKAVGYVKRVIVHPNFRRQGLSRLLMEHIIAYARTEQHLGAIDLHVWEQNIPAIKLYESLGFQVQHRELYFHLSL